MVQAFDNRERLKLPTRGLYQAMTYHAGHSAGGMLVSALAGNAFSPISQITKHVWYKRFKRGILPQKLRRYLLDPQISGDLDAKRTAGFEPTLVDVYGRLLSHIFVGGKSGGVNTTLSSVAQLSDFVNHNVPFPIISALGTQVWKGECRPGPNQTTYEFTPFEFGSWDREVSAFTPTRYLGTKLQNGEPTGECITQYDNLGYILASSANTFSEENCPEPTDKRPSEFLFGRVLELLKPHRPKIDSGRDYYAPYPNPFYRYFSPTSTPSAARDIAAQEEISLVDGSATFQSNPLFPLLQPARNISVIFVNDNSMQTDASFPDGSGLEATYKQAMRAGLTRMPFIPPPKTFLSRKLNKQATFFGCYEHDKATIIYLPNADYEWSHWFPWWDNSISYKKDDTFLLLNNGHCIATQGTYQEWSMCLACAILMKTGQMLPSRCSDCFGKYCYDE